MHIFFENSSEFCRWEKNFISLLEGFKGNNSNEKQEGKICITTRSLFAELIPPNCRF